MAISFTPLTHDRLNPYISATSQTIAKGDPVVLNSSGLVEVATASSAALLGIAGTAVTSAAAGASILVFDDPEAVIRCKCDTAGENVQTITGETHDLVGSTGAFYVNSGATTTNVFRVLQIGVNMDPILDGTFTKFDGGVTMLVKIALHQLIS